MEQVRSSLQAGVAAVLCVMMTATTMPMLAAPVALAKPPKAAKTQAKPKIDELSGDERILQALNRLTWGPRPGDVAAVRAMGLEKWIDAQLNPSRLDDSAVESVEANFPGLELTPEEMVRHFPDNNFARAADNGRVPLPSDPYLHAVYRNAIARYENQQAKKQAATAAAAVPMAGGNMAGGMDSSMAGGGMTNAATSDSTSTSMAGTTPTAANSMQGNPVAGTLNPRKPGAAANGKNAQAGGGASPDIRVNEAKIKADLEATAVLNLTPQERLVRLIQMEPEELNAFRSHLSPVERAELAKGMTPQQREIVASLENPVVVVGAELMQEKLLRSIETSRQLEDVMTDFWLNHFNVYIKKGQPEEYYIAQYERDVLRPHALGKFEDLLVATAKSPAMLFYLDNWTSVGPDSMQVQRAQRAAAFSGNPQAKLAADRGLNENYGRELMELHTLGVGNYTQADVTQMARVFTGWTIDKPQAGGGYVFDEKRHEPGPKTVLGHVINESGEQEGLEVLHILAMSPATAQHVSREIAQRFVADDPPAMLVDRMAKSWMASGGDIRVVLKTMLSSPEFWAKDDYRVKVKTPLEYVVSAVRASDATVASSLALVLSLDRLDMPLFGQQPPTGYPMTADRWVSTSALVTRMNFALYLASGKMPGVLTDWSGLITESAGGKGKAGMVFDAADWAPSDRELRLETLLLGAEASHQTHDAVMQQMVDQPGNDPNAMEKQFPLRQNPVTPVALIGIYGAVPEAKAMSPEEKQLSTMAGLLMGSPEFQRR